MVWACFWSSVNDSAQAEHMLGMENLASVDGLTIAITQLEIIQAATALAGLHVISEWTLVDLEALSNMKTGFDNEGNMAVIVIPPPLHLPHNKGGGGGRGGFTGIIVAFCPFLCLSMSMLCPEDTFWTT